MGKIVLWIVIFGVMGFLSYLRKRQEERQARERQEESRQHASELPEKTRQMLYGSGVEPRTATAARGQSESHPPIHTARPRQPQQTHRPVSDRRPPQQSSSARTAMPERRPPAQRPGSSIRGAIEQVAEALRDQLEELEESASPQPVPPRRAAPPPLQAPASTRQRRAIASPPHRRREAPHTRPTAKRKTAAKRARAQQPMQRRRGTRVRPHSRRLFSGLHDVRRGIILCEVLGTPKGLEDF